MDSLLAPDCLIPRVFRSWWQDLDPAEQQCLRKAAHGELPPGNRGWRNDMPRETADHLVAFGLLAQGPLGYRPAGELLRQWLLSHDARTNRPRVFLGHGHGSAWKMFHYTIEKEVGYEVVAYESVPREGQNIPLLIEKMVGSADYAAIVLTADEELKDGRQWPRMNPVHELGLCQSRLGLERVVVLLEKGVEEISNLAGVQVIRFDHANDDEACRSLARYFTSRRP